MKDFTERMILRTEQIDVQAARKSFVDTAKEFRAAQIKYDLYTLYNSDGKIPEEVTDRYLAACAAFDRAILDVGSHYNE